MDVGEQLRIEHFELRRRPRLEQPATPQLDRPPRREDKPAVTIALSRLPELSIAQLEPFESVTAGVDAPNEPERGEASSKGKRSQVREPVERRIE